MHEESKDTNKTKVSRSIKKFKSRDTRRSLKNIQLSVFEDPGRWMFRREFNIQNGNNLDRDLYNRYNSCIINFFAKRKISEISKIVTY